VTTERTNHDHELRRLDAEISRLDAELNDAKQLIERNSRAEHWGKSPESPWAWQAGSNGSVARAGGAETR
jgi:hypothetical protein